MSTQKVKKTISLPKLPYGEGSMSIRKNGQIMYRKRIGNEKNECTVYGDTPKECMVKMRLAESQAEDILDKNDSDKTTLGDAMIFWLENIKKNRLKKQSYRRLQGTITNQIKTSDIGNIRYKLLNSEDIQQLINKLNDKKYSHSTIKKAYDALNDFYKYASVKEKIDNPMLLVNMPIRDNIIAEEKDVDFFEQSDLDKFIAECGVKWQTGTLKYKYGYILAANIYLGLRIGELLALQWKDIDFDKNTIYVSKTLIQENNEEYDVDNQELMKIENIKKVLFTIQHSTKTRKNRFVPVNSKAKELILRYKNSSDFIEQNDYIISTKNRKTSTIKNVSDTIKMIEKNANTTVQLSGTHILRHTCASLYFRKGVPIETISKILGHSVEVCKKTYVHFVNEQLQDAASKIEVIEI